MIVIYKNELYHHGIEGQKWGVRNGPPYPLDRNGNPRKMSDKKRRKALIKAASSNKTNHLNRVNAARKYMSDIKKTKAFKEYDKLVRETGESDPVFAYNRTILNQDAYRRNASTGRAFNVWTLDDRGYAIYQNYFNKLRESLERNISDYSGAVLRDLGYEDTRQGREYLMNLFNVDDFMYNL